MIFRDPDPYVPAPEPPSLAAVQAYRADLAARRVAVGSWPRDAEARRRHELAQLPEAPTELYRVLVPASPGQVVDAEPEGVPQGPRLMAQAALEAGAEVRVTYSLAEGSSGLLEAHAVRVRREGARGWASWWNGQANAAQWLARGAQYPRNVGMTEYRALATGQPYEPPAPRPAPPVGPCPRCGRQVRWRINATAPEPYKHNREITDESKITRKEPCT